MFADENNPKLKKTTRTIVIKPIDGKKPLNSTGLVDPRLFSGENSLIAVMDPRTCLWQLRYTTGAVPNQMKQRFTSFARALACAEDYFKKRNMQIIEVID